MKNGHKLVLIEWLDSHSGRGWQPLDEIQHETEPAHCRSVGWLVAQNKKSAVLVPHISGEKNGDLRLFGRGEITIPTKAVVRMTVLKAS